VSGVETAVWYFVLLGVLVGAGIGILRTTNS